MGLSRAAWGELGRRASALVGVLAAVLAGPGLGRHELAALVLAVAILVYVVPPRPRPPAGALRPDRLSSTWLPDLIGFLLAGVFLGLPLVIAARQAVSGPAWPYILFFLPPGLVALGLFRVAVRYQCLWVLIEDDGFTLGRMAGIDRIAFAEITGVRLRQRRLPRWVSGLLWLSGNLQAKATAMLHAGRASSWLELDCHGRPALIVPADGFPGLEALIEAFQRFGIPLDPSILPRRPRRAAKGEQHEERPMDIPS